MIEDETIQIQDCISKMAPSDEVLSISIRLQKLLMEQQEQE